MSDLGKQFYLFLTLIAHIDNSSFNNDEEHGFCRLKILSEN